MRQIDKLSVEFQTEMKLDALSYNPATTRDLSNSNALTWSCYLPDIVRDKKARAAQI